MNIPIKTISITQAEDGSWVLACQAGGDSIRIKVASGEMDKAAWGDAFDRILEGYRSVLNKQNGI